MAILKFLPSFALHQRVLKGAVTPVTGGQSRNNRSPVVPRLFITISSYSQTPIAGFSCQKCRGSVATQLIKYCTLIKHTEFLYNFIGKEF